MTMEIPSYDSRKLTYILVTWLSQIMPADQKNLMNNLANLIGRYG